MAKTKQAPTFNLSRHKIRFRTFESDTLKTAVQEVQVLIRAKNGWTTEAIAYDLGLTKGQVTYRIKKGLAVGDRGRFRSGSTWVAQAALVATAHRIIAEVGTKISPKYL